MMDRSDAKSFFNKLHLLNIPYWTTGGVAIDAMRGYWSRAHGDIDIYVPEHHLPFFKDVFWYACFKKGNILLVQKPGLKVDVLPLSNEGDELVIHGNRAETRFPKELFGKRYCRIYDIELSVVSNEVLIADSRWACTEDQSYTQALPHDATLLDRIKNIQKDKRKYELKPIARAH